MPLIEVFFSIIALLQLVTLLRILRNFLVATSERIFQYTAIFLEKRIFRKMYVLSAWNDCYEIVSAVLTLHAAFLSSSLRFVGYGRGWSKFANLECNYCLCFVYKQIWWTTLCCLNSRVFFFLFIIIWLQFYSF